MAKMGTPIRDKRAPILSLLREERLDLVLQSDKVMSHGVEDERYPVFNLELAKDRGEVVRHSSFTDVQAFGNLLISQTLTDQLNHLLLTSTDRRFLLPVCMVLFPVAVSQQVTQHPFGNGALKPQFSAIDSAYSDRNVVHRPFALENAIDAKT